jgi:hypothetical protein
MEELCFLRGPCREVGLSSIWSLPSSELSSVWISLELLTQQILSPFSVPLLVNSLYLSWLHADRICNIPCNGTLRSCGRHRNVSSVVVWTIFTYPLQRIHFCMCCLGIDVSVITLETCFNKPLYSNGFTCHNIKDRWGSELSQLSSVRESVKRGLEPEAEE